ncbi:hypothetical protein BC939DRAFT_507944 [Gamsiella multidivaricata]|uniref:uncharacterized protein n=1 Tax=Gamsiella multidivaricata TaxID=101098 RepID=UPI00221E6FB4|nr:uncharacterized protein BC939DRAFT_507944 [Gamsiella multidivaricata]KAI7816789.1 hypothetical protein BC939DRAFT_507944 [Gamsiella multidivaricata]
MAHELASEKYGEFFRLLSIGDRVEIKADPLRNQITYGMEIMTMNRLLEDNSNTYGQAPLDGYMKRAFANHKARKQAAAEGTEPPYRLTSQVVTASKSTAPSSSKTKTRIPEITSRFSSKGSLAKAFDQDLRGVVVVGVDSGEAIPAWFYALGSGIKNLPIKRPALYSPSLSFRVALEAKKRERVRVMIEDGQGGMVYMRDT